MKNSVNDLHQRLRTLAQNLWWTWHPEVIRLFTDLDPHLAPGPFIKLTVSDSGHGIAPEVKDRIFDPFYTTKEPGKGTGLGLSIIYGIVKMHRGDIHVQSTEGEGSEFVISLPIRLPDISLPEGGGIGS